MRAENFKCLILDSETSRSGSSALGAAVAANVPMSWIYIYLRTQEVTPEAHGLITAKPRFTLADNFRIAPGYNRTVPHPKYFVA